MNPYGEGPFCRFSIPKSTYNLSGVYFIFEDDALQYIGKCSNLGSRFNDRYGVIYQRNCRLDGQQTNCRINQLILERIKKGANISLYFYETLLKDELEIQLISKYRPIWNLSQKKSKQSTNFPMKRENSQNRKVNTYTNHGKYQNLKEFLTNSKMSEIILSYHEIEQILGFSLPFSAYKYRAWWSNDQSHSQARSWLDAGWKVVKVEMGHSITYSKDNYTPKW